MAFSNKLNIKTYQDFINSCSDVEINQLSQLKRLALYMDIDAEFAERVNNSPGSSEVKEVLNQIGVEFDPRGFNDFWTEENSSLFNFIVNEESDREGYGKLEEAFNKYPLVKLWFEFNRVKQVSYRKSIRSSCIRSVSDRRFDVWRKRRIKACRSELGHFGNCIEHPLFAFELSKGCSVGCWFCAFDSEKLETVFEYSDENRELWRQIVAAGAAFFGRDASAAMCYYATEPFDNPHYVDFMKDYHEITGSYLCTATAAPLKNKASFRELIRFYREEAVPWPRISMLSAEMARRVFSTYSVNELRDVEYLNQAGSSKNEKAVSGRTLKLNRIKSGEEKKSCKKKVYSTQDSIACVSGFYVNMVDKIIKLISPCRASDRWPKGYRVFGETTFSSAEDYIKKLNQLMDKHMSEKIEPDMRISFRDDLTFIAEEEGFVLKSHHQEHKISGEYGTVLIGQLISEGDMTYKEISDQLQSRGVHSLVISGFVTNLFDEGFINEVSC